MNKVVCDASSLISLSENCMLPALQNITDKLQFIVPNEVYKEVVKNPLHSKKYAFKAFLLDKYFDDGLIHHYKDDIHPQAMKIMNLANSVFEMKRRPLKIIHIGEAAAIALCNKLDTKGLLIDERTTRLLIEDPMKLKKYMTDRRKKEVKIDHQKFSEFKEEVKNLKIIRSAELAVYSYESGWFNHKATEKTLEDMLFSLKFAGCSITSDEIKKYKEIIG